MLPLKRLRYAMARPPEQLGSIRLTRQLGLGRRCQIWEGIEAGGAKRVAVKVATPEAAGNAELKRLLKHELTVAQSLDHPAIIKIDRYSTAGGLPHLVMELFRHPNLKQRLTGGPGPLAGQAQKIAVDVADAVTHLHERGWVHRDLKPENILLDDSGTVRVIDLALAVRPAGLLGRLLPRRTKAQGSISYMPPEQIRGGTVDQRTDLYAFGCLLYELLTGRPPFTASTQQELLGKQLHAVAPSALTTNEAVSPQLDGLLRTLLAKKPTDRPDNMRELTSTLRQMAFFKPGSQAGGSSNAN
jgi:serine/threonine protein kinase